MRTSSFHPSRTVTLCCALLGSLLATGQVFTADAEPNNIFSSAIPITLGTPFEGQLNVIPGDHLDLYSFVLPDDGVLLLEVESEQTGAAAPFLAIRGYALGDTVQVMPAVAYPDMGTFGTVIQDSSQVHCMKAGLHYLRVGGLLEDTTTTPRSYRITATHRPMAFANDPEPNNDTTMAVPVQQGQWAEGRLSVEWPYNDPTDIFDYWLIHKTVEGPLVLETEVAAEYDNAQNELFDFHVDKADLSQSSGNDGWVAMGSQGVPNAAVAVYSTMIDTGLYHVMLLNPTVHGISYRFSWSVGTVGISRPDGSSPIDLSPNPAAGLVTIRGAAMDLVQLIDARGRTVRTVRAGGSDRVEVDLSSLSPGPYLVRATLRDGGTVMERMVVGR